MLKAYRDHAAERALLEGGGRREQLPALAACLAPDAIAQLQAQATAVHAAPALLDYVQALLAATRNDARFEHGLSPRAGLGLLAAARAWAFIAGRTMVLPEDVQAVLPSVAAHRLRLARGEGHARSEDVIALIHATPLP